jgi:D-alanyl-lipoteichoic acid acyltransferase DltB (MBOAT superfamily)
MISWNALIDQLKFQVESPLVFNSSFFFFFFTFFFLIYALVHKRVTLRLWIVSIFSLFFFYKACGEYVIFILIAAVIDYNLSHVIYNSNNKKIKKTLLISSIALNLGLLFYFKYTDFFIQMMNDWGGGNYNLLHLALPVGISFYTFENLSYTIDVYKGHFKPVNKFIDYLFFLSYFPKLMMGPIVRAADFLPQIRKQIELKAEDVSYGFYFILSGAFKKMVISDFLYTNIVQVVFDDPTRFSGLYCLTAAYAYAMVIYCDFSGYSDMAIGIARWMGLKIEINFLAPYQSSSITEFWRRWHISLSSWLRDYLYIPLGGNRKGNIRTYFNLFLTMLLGGFWHGANWTFLVWGALHGIALALDKLRLGKRKPTYMQSGFSWKKIIGITFTFHFVVLCWIYFGPSSIEKSNVILEQIFTNMDLSAWKDFAFHYRWVLATILGAFILHQIPLNWNDRIIQLITKTPFLIKIALFIAILIGVGLLKADVPVAPIYLQF